MKKLKIYLDTSVINFLFAEDVPELKKITKEFFRLVKEGRFDVFISDTVVNEILKTEDEEKKRKLLSVIEEHRLIRLPAERDEEVSALAEFYIKRGVVPKQKVGDALYIAYSTVFEMDILLSWNFKHLANIRCERLMYSANIEKGYNYPLRLTTPMEVEYEEENENF